MVIARDDFVEEIPDPRILAGSITRDGYANPSRRLADKHIRLFHGRTLDEWFAIRCWASQYVTDWYIVGETEEHCERIRPLMEQYGGEVICREAAHLHPIEDTGGVPMRYGLRVMLERHGWYNGVIQNFVVNPVHPPDYFDNMVKEFVRQYRGGAEGNEGPVVLQPVFRPQLSFYAELPNGRIQIQGPPTQNTGKSSDRWATMGGITISSVDYLLHSWQLFFAGDWRLAFGGEAGQMKMEVPWWTEVHIDTDEEWDLAEFWFGKYIGVGDNALQAYATYREGWA